MEIFGPQRLDLYFQPLRSAIGALIITYDYFGVPYYKYSITIGVLIIITYTILVFLIISRV